MDAFERLYREHSGRLYNLAYRMSGTAADAEELVQEMFLLAHRKIGSFKGESSIGTWLYRLGVNLCVDYLRSSRHRTGPGDRLAGRRPRAREPAGGGPDERR